MTKELHYRVLPKKFSTGEMVGVAPSGGGAAATEPCEGVEVVNEFGVEVGTVWGVERGGKGGGNCMASTPDPIKPWLGLMSRHTQSTETRTPSLGFAYR